MSDFRAVSGFEDVWRPPVRQRRVRLEAHGPGAAGQRARLTRLVARVPEVMVKVTGRTRDGAHLKAHLDYIARNGQLDLEGPDGAVIRGRREVAELAGAWWDLAQSDPRRRANTPASLSVVLSMPAGASDLAVRDAARAFAEDMFAGRHEYVFTLHTDTPRPHVHLSICARGHTGERLNPKKADLEAWRQAFAQALRDRGVEAEATPRRARGVIRKSDREPVGRIAARAAIGAGPAAHVHRAADLEAVRAAVQDDPPAPWALAAARRQLRIRGLYLAQARLLQASADPRDRDLGQRVETFLAQMPPVETRHMALARQVREVARTGPGRRSAAKADPDRAKDR